MGSWEAEHGVLGRVYVLREFEDDAELAAERMRAAHSSRPFGAGDHLTDLTMQGFAPFPFMPPPGGPEHILEALRRWPGRCPDHPLH